jgi:hypothetical protein
MTVTEKKPVQVYLGRRHQNLLEQLVEKLGLSQAETLRRGLEALAREKIPPEEDPAWQLIGLMGEETESPGDLSVEHDKYLAEWAANE